MIYKLIIEKTENLKKLYLDARIDMKPESDSIHVLRKGELMTNITKEDIYKKILKLEGQFRNRHNLWTLPAAKIKVV